MTRNVSYSVDMDVAVACDRVRDALTTLRSAVLCALPPDHELESFEATCRKLAKYADAARGEALALAHKANLTKRVADRAAQRSFREHSKLKVYGWSSRRNDCPPAPNGGRQVRYIVAATSWAAAARAVPGESLSHMKAYGSTTGNVGELEQALSQPGAAYWLPLNESIGSSPKTWRQA